MAPILLGMSFPSRLKIAAFPAVTELPGNASICCAGVQVQAVATGMHLSHQALVSSPGDFGRGGRFALLGGVEADGAAVTNGQAPAQGAPKVVQRLNLHLRFAGRKN